MSSPAVMVGWKLQMLMLAWYCITGEAFGNSGDGFHWCQVEMSPSMDGCHNKDDGRLRVGFAVHQQWMKSRAVGSTK